MSITSVHQSRPGFISQRESCGPDPVRILAQNGDKLKPLSHATFRLANNTAVGLFFSAAELAAAGLVFVMWLVYPYSHVSHGPD